MGMIDDCREWLAWFPACDRAIYMLSLRIVDFAESREEIEACGWRGDAVAWEDYKLSIDVGIQHVSEVLRQTSGMQWSRAAVSTEVVALIREIMEGSQ